jgi:hypothetical protein
MLVSFLIENGYSVRVTTHKGIASKQSYQFAYIDNSKGIIAGFCTPTIDCYKYINNRIAADNADCFDRWSKCPLVMAIPLNGDALLKHLEWLSSKDGYNHSMSYAYLNKRVLPYEMG